MVFDLIRKIVVEEEITKECLIKSLREWCNINHCVDCPIHDENVNDSLFATCGCELDGKKMLSRLHEMDYFNKEKVTGFQEILFAEYSPVNIEEVFDEHLDRIYSIEGPLAMFDYSFLFKNSDPSEYRALLNNFIDSDYNQYAGEYWKSEDFENALKEYDLIKDDDTD